MSLNSKQYYTSGRTFQSKGNQSMLNAIEKNAYNPTRKLTKKRQSFVNPELDEMKCGGNVRKMEDGGLIKMGNGDEKTKIVYEPLEHRYYMSGPRIPGTDAVNRLGLGIEHDFTSKALKRQGFDLTGGLHAGIPYEKNSGASIHGFGEFKAKTKAMPGTPFNVQPSFQVRSGWDPNTGLSGSWHGMLKGRVGNVPSYKYGQKGTWDAWLGAGYGNEWRNLEQFFTKPTAASEGYVPKDKRFTATPGILEAGFNYHPRKDLRFTVKGGVRGSAIEDKGKGIAPYFTTQLAVPIKPYVIDPIKSYIQAYKDVDDEDKPSIASGKKHGRHTPKLLEDGGEVMELTDKEIQELRSGGHIVIEQ